MVDLENVSIVSKLNGNNRISMPDTSRRTVPPEVLRPLAQLLKHLLCLLGIWATGRPSVPSRCVVSQWPLGFLLPICITNRTAALLDELVELSAKNADGTNFFLIHLRGLASSHTAFYCWWNVNSRSPKITSITAAISVVLVLLASMMTMPPSKFSRLMLTNWMWKEPQFRSQPHQTALQQLFQLSLWFMGLGAAGIYFEFLQFLAQPHLISGV